LLLPYYLDAKPGGVQLYSSLLLEGFSRTILAGSLTPDQEAGELLHLYFQALLKWGMWEEVISDQRSELPKERLAARRRRMHRRDRGFGQ
jgi:hypothetical protein